MDRGVIVGGLLVASSLALAVFFNSHAPDRVQHAIDAPAAHVPAATAVTGDAPAVGTEAQRAQPEPVIIDRPHGPLAATAEIY
jgi:hypothetical protein